jgi:hypothetical protein
MFQENEVINLLVTFGIFLFVMLFWSELSEAYHLKVLTIVLFLTLISGIFTLLEHLIWPTQLNYLEHFSDVLRSAVLLIWGLLLLPKKS